MSEKKNKTQTTMVIKTLWRKKWNKKITYDVCVDRYVCLHPNVYFVYNIALSFFVDYNPDLNN